ncbi:MULTISPECIES: TetR/AcrR family transcriptional regulator [unclassified Oceanispirochaeta]|uniref:TetR/AcrR family transcriptional regulator n=1 Tax=unclassified Oceanispirochaeta TaxID=2635722 RepID=UPI000E094AAE|nr:MULTISPECIES: TetR/AcrR family transcriptional regulator [unclassified Oceanispirochaeta]MBF9014936.1 TetR/AcrR family transcriptional regulator [Oceanispirochaeta sp. M2]NPD71383.1 TetR/AcrR family transcriptional regulator [Oceanispirochaeta sp. M1]RDG33348.1 TetR/AcrR family transcriptional regulator [Oceanispirochaeta sp. M1]
MGTSDTKKQLELKALQFFARNDFERSNLNDIAKALGVTKGAIYHYFSSKEDLFLAAVNQLLDMMMDMFGQGLPRDIPINILLDNLFHMEEMMVEVSRSLGLEEGLNEYKNILYLFLTGIKKFPDLQERIDALYSGFTDSLEDLLNAGIVRGEIRRDVDSKAIAYEITAFYEGALLLGAFSNKKDYIVLGPRVCQSIWERIAVESVAAIEGRK